MFNTKQCPFVVVLPHERLFLDRLPSADRYYKSFMHRDVINFAAVTRCVGFSA
jgi:peptidylprolyl isomerase domain and WD repeat-containing protein 1